jgi:hypothetical protein
MAVSPGASNLRSMVDPDGQISNPVRCDFRIIIRDFFRARRSDGQKKSDPGSVGQARVARVPTHWCIDWANSMQNDV